MSVAEQLEVSARRMELEAVVDILTLPEKRILDDGRRAEALPLLCAVRDAATARDRAGSSARGHESAPARLACLELLADVERTVAVVSRRGSLLADVRAWATALTSNGDLDALIDAVEVAYGWTDRARSLLEPRRTLPLRGALCPACGARDVTEDGSLGEVVVNPTLVADLGHGTVSCSADGCGAVWAADELYLLADQLDRQTVEVLAVEE